MIISPNYYDLNIFAWILKYVYSNTVKQGLHFFEREMIANCFGQFKTFKYPTKVLISQFNWKKERKIECLIEKTVAFVNNIGRTTYFFLLLLLYVGFSRFLILLYYILTLSSLYRHYCQSCVNINNWAYYLVLR